MRSHNISKAEMHPCLSLKAARKYARLHLPVSTKCNIRCNYCYRGYDCINENRPGITSKVLSPWEAFSKCEQIMRQIPQLKVVGIAGPGDSLANPDQTFKTFEFIRNQYPEISLCLATNGLSVLDNIDEINFYRVEYVTITINAVDPIIGRNIYRWININNTIYRGSEAAKILWQRQQAGLTVLAENGVLVKVNTVLIPGINDSHILEIAHQTKAHGAYAMNIMPLIPLAHTAFRDIAPPLRSDLNRITERCSKHISIVRHCRKCRSDAAGFLLNEDGSSETEVKTSHKAS